jgi:hypothetical protein
MAVASDRQVRHDFKSSREHASESLDGRYSRKIAGLRQLIFFCSRRSHLHQRVVIKTEAVLAARASGRKPVPHPAAGDEAAKHTTTEKAAHHAHVARPHAIHARGHAEEAAKAHHEEHGNK